MHIIFDINKQDMRNKFFCGWRSYARYQYVWDLLVKCFNFLVRLLLLISTQNDLNLIAGDVGNTFPTSTILEKLWFVAGPEFGKLKGFTIEVIRALYGLETTACYFHKWVGYRIRSLGFTASRVDHDHMNDIIIISSNPQVIMSMIEPFFLEV